MKKNKMISIKKGQLLSLKIPNILTIYKSLLFFLFIFCGAKVCFGQDYFPLKIGNQWIYGFSGLTGYSKIEIVDTMRIGQYLYYQTFEQQSDLDWPVYAYYRKDSLNQVLVYDNSEGEYITYKLNATVGTSWYKYSENFTYRTTLVDTCDIITTPAGIFQHCYQFNTLIEELYTDFKEWLAPDIGVILRENEGMGYVLRGAWVNDILYGDTTITQVKNLNHITALQVFKLFQNYPNPFNMSTQISYLLAEANYSPTNLKIYDINGREVKTLVNKIQNAGEYSIKWDGRDNFGRCVSTGIYIYELTVDNYHETRKLVLTK